MVLRRKCTRGGKGLINPSEGRLISPKEGKMNKEKEQHMLQNSFGGEKGGGG